MIPILLPKLSQAETKYLETGVKPSQDQQLNAQQKIVNEIASEFLTFIKRSTYPFTEESNQIWDWKITIQSNGKEMLLQYSKSKGCLFLIITKAMNTAYHKKYSKDSILYENTILKLTQETKNSFKEIMTLNNASLQELPEQLEQAASSFFSGTMRRRSSAKNIILQPKQPQSY